MSRRTDISKILVLGAGPIRVGQACEFDYSGTQACNALKEEGYEVVLVNSNPATIMTDPSRATRTYIEPLTPATVREIIAIERPHALLPTVGGQTALNLAVALAEQGTLAEFNVELIGASLESINLAEDRELFKSKMLEIGMPVPKSAVIEDLKGLARIAESLGFPIIVRPAFTLGGSGSGIAHGVDDLVKVCAAGLLASPVHKVLLEESVVGWKEIEFEVVRDRADNFIVVCAIENLDPMGIHTGDSITVAPIQTLSDKEYQTLRDASKDIIRAIGIDCGGSNIQFAVNKEDGRFVVIEMNPRVSRSSALASKATGYPIAKVAARLAVGFTLDEIRNDIVGDVSACFEPVLDYVVTKLPRFEFGKFAGGNNALGTQMKSVGEAMGIGATFQESLQKALRSLELGVKGFAPLPSRNETDASVWRTRMQERSRFRMMDIWGALAAGIEPQEISDLSGIDYWFVDNLAEIWETHCRTSERYAGKDLASISKEVLFELKAMGFGDGQLADLLDSTEDEVFQHRTALGVSPFYRRVDTCAGEFPTTSNYFYSSYGCTESDTTTFSDESVIILGSGPNRIGQGIEFDYACVQASLCLKEQGLKPIMVNCNPETVSTDYNVSSTLYFEPISLEDVSNIVLREKPRGIIIQLGGQTPLKLAHALERRGFKILGTSVRSVDAAEDRNEFLNLLDELKLTAPAGAIVHSLPEAQQLASEIGYPVLIRPSYVLGGRAMQVVHNAAQLATFLASGFDFQTGILIDQYLTNAIEVDVDALCDGRQTVIAGVMEHIEEAGIHSGDSSCVMPPHSLDADMIERIKGICKMLAEALQVQGFINIQLAVQDGGIYVLEANPRASRTIPFVSKATGIPWAAIGTRVIMGETLESLEHLYANPVHCVAVKSVVLPFNKFPEAEVKVGPEMRSTGEVMGIGADVHEAYRKAQSAADRHLRAGKSIWLSGSRMRIAEIATLAEKISSSPAFAAASRNRIAKLSAQDPGHTHFLATEPAKLFLSEKLEECLFIPDARFLPTDSVDLIKSLLSTHDVGLVISLGLIDTANELEQKLRRAAINANIPLIMSFSDALMSVNCLFDPHNQSFTPVALQDLAQPATRGEPESAPQHRDTLATFEGSHRQQEV